MALGKLKVCAKGHQFRKTSECPSCPMCESERKPSEGFLSAFAAPARRALENQKITSLKEVSRLSEDQFGSLHGIGPNAVKKIKKLLKQAGLKFKVS